ncbi:hypothetical protein D3C74_361840 [compost metagenome]
MFTDFCGGKRTLQQPLGDRIKIGKRLIQRGQQAGGLQLRNPDNIQPGYIGQFTATAVDLQLLMQLIPRKRHGIHLNARILLFEFGNQLLG